ncbi:MAG TPA: tRNA (guanosine(37)-N1)-methyltransferase TrmD [bacterium]|nr:tRNA (guanosine(37)-N1)-methyltransferase TrmD [bacterium]HPQ67415.1 tRNA (guanosine(37)-N1)-methyltransferase TrmD [bacterium]
MSVNPIRIDIVTLFPGMFSGYLDESIVKRAREKGLVRFRIVNLREYTHDRHRTADDRPYGGGSGMVLKPEPIFEAIDDLASAESRVVLLSPRGVPYRQEAARRLSRERHLILICGHYEGVDERVREALVDEELSVGDYILTNGALPALVVADSLVRLVPGVLGDEESSLEESFSRGLLEYPHYTRPRVYRGREVPPVLLSGDHEAIARWRLERAREITRANRPDLLETGGRGGENP